MSVSATRDDVEAGGGGTVAAADVEADVELEVLLALCLLFLTKSRLGTRGLVEALSLAQQPLTRCCLPGGGPDAADSPSTFSFLSRLLLACVRPTGSRRGDAVLMGCGLLGTEGTRRSPGLELLAVDIAGEVNVDLHDLQAKSMCFMDFGIILTYYE